MLRVAVVLMELGIETFPIVLARSATLVVWYQSGWEMWRVFAPVYQRASERHPDVLFGRVDANREAALARCCRIDSIPTLMGLCRGRLAYLRARHLRRRIARRIARQGRPRAAHGRGHERAAEARRRSWAAAVARCAGVSSGPAVM